MQTAIDSAAEGDTVIVPVGDCTWTAGVVISGKGIHLRGETKGGVNVTHSAGSSDLIRVTTDLSHHTEISNLTLLAGSASGSAEYIFALGSGKPVLIHDNYFRNSSFRANCISLATVGGVIWNNTFESLDANGSEGGCLQLKNTNATTSWSTASTMGAADTTGAANIYIENNVFRKITLQAIDVDDNVRAVIRHNTFDNSGIVFHGADTSPDGARHVELYNNTFTFTPSGSGYNFPLNINWWVYMRGGSGVFTDNVMDNINSQTWGNKIEINMTVQNLRRIGGDFPCWTTYPAPHQVGQSHNGSSAVTDPFYIWNNTGTGSQTPLIRDYEPDECGNGLRSADFIRLDRDYVIGTLKPGYSKYTYPHPLTAGVQPPPTGPSLSVNDVTVAEGSAANFTVSLSAASTQTVTVLAGTSNGTAVAPGDFTARSNVTIAFPPGTITQSFAVTTLSDAVTEGNETFTVSLSGAINATIADAQGVGAITNVGPPAPPSVITHPAGQIASVGQTATFSVSAAGAAPLSYQWKKNGIDISGATGASYTTPTLALADSGSAYSVTVSNSLGFVTSNSATLTVTALAGPVASYNFDDGSGTTLSDRSGTGNNGTIANATWNATGKNGSSLTFNGTNSWISIADSNSLDLSTGMTLEAWVYPALQSGWRTVVLKESTGQLSYALYSSNDAAVPAAYIGTASTVGTAALPINTWTHVASTFDGTTLRLFVNGAQVSSSASGSITPSAGALRIGGNSVWGEYFAGRIDDVRIYNRALSVAEIQSDMSNPVPGGGTPPPPATLSVNDVTVAEGGTANFTVSLSAASTQTVTVLAGTANGAAVAPGDFTARSGVTITFPPGTTTQSFAVTTLSDTVTEGNETFTVNLSGAINATIADAQGAGTITNVVPTPALPTLSVNDVAVAEGGTANFTVTLSAASAQTVTVLASTADGTAAAGSDYTARSGVTLTFPAGVATQTFAVSSLADTIPEGNEIFTVNLTGATNATIADAQGQGTITNVVPPGACP